MPGQSCTKNLNTDRALKIIDVYGKRLTSNNIFANKMELLTVKCFTYTPYTIY